MAGVVTVRLLEALKGLGVDVSQQSGSNVKTLATKNKSSATKTGLLASERNSGGNFSTVLDIFKKEAKYIDGMNDVEQMAFLNNIMDYNEFGGKPIKGSGGINSTEEMAKFKTTQSELKKALEDLNSTAKTMKDDAEAGLASAKNDLKDFFETGGNPLKKKETKYLGGSMHEEGQLRTAIRTFLQNEYKNGRINLNKLDAERVMEYSPMIEHDPILVFKKIYGNEAYTKAGTFPGAFEIGEDFKHYEKIFRENMGEDLLKVKDKKYVGDGKLVLTKKEEVFEPTPDDDDIPFATGGRASFSGGKFIDEIIAMIVKKEPIEAMKEVNKIIGKKGKYKNLTQKDIDRIVDQSNDWIFQRDPDNLYVEDRPMFKQKEEPDTQVFKDSEGGIKGITIGGDDEFKKAMSEAMEEGMRESENMKRLGLDPTKMEDALKYDQMKEAGQMEKNITGLSDMSEADALRQKYPGISDDLVNKILIDDNPQRKAELLGTLDEAFRMMEKGKGADEVLEIFKNTSRTKNSTGGRAGFREGGMGQLELPFGEPLFTMKMNGKLFGIYKQSNGNHLSVPLGSDGKPNYAQGGRAGYYMGGQATVEPDLSDIGHGSDSLMARTRITAPGSQATTSTGLNYLLGEDNDNVRVPFKGGGRIGLDDGGFLEEALAHYDYYLKFGGKIPFRQFLGTFSKENRADGGRIGFAGGGADMGTVSGDTRKATAKSVSVSPSGQVTTSTTRGPEGPDDRTRGNFDQNVNHREAMRNYQKPPKSKLENIFNTGQEISYLRNLKNVDPYGLAIDYGINKFAPIIMKTLKNLRSEADIEKDGIMKMANNDFTKFNFEDLTGMKPVNNSDYTQLAKVYGAPELTEFGATPGRFKDTAKFNDMEKYQELANKQMSFDPVDGSYRGKQPSAIRESIGLGDSLYGINMDNIPKDFLETQDDFKNQKILGDIKFADGGIAGLRQGYGGGSLVDKGRRGFLKFLGGTAAGVVALKAGLVKLLSKESGAVSRKVIDEVIIDSGSGAPAWLQPLVNKALREGTDISKQAIKDGQVVKSLDTPTGKVDVYYDVRSGEIDIDYIGGNTALGESVQMRYKPGVADEGTKGVKPADEFEAVESVPENTTFGYDDYELTVGEHSAGDVKGLYSDTSELAELGGQKPLIKDISETIKKKKVLKQMEDDPMEFATEGYSTGQFYNSN